MANDRYESEHMSAEGKVLYREKLVTKLMFWALGIPAVLSTLLGLYLALGLGAGEPWWSGAFAIGIGIMFAVFSLVFSVLRTVVTSKEVHIQYGLWGPRIPVEKITACTAIDYKWAKYGGWGIKRAVDGTWAYSVLGQNRAVAIEWVDGGKTEKAVVSAKDAEALVRQIQKARALAAARIDVDDSVDETLAEEEALAEEQALEAEQARTRARTSPEQPS